MNAGRCADVPGASLFDAGTCADGLSGVALADAGLCGASLPTVKMSGTGERSSSSIRGKGAVTGRHRRTLASWQVDTAKRLLRSRLNEPVAIAEIAGACGLSPCYFIKAFTGTVGITPYTWLIDRRLEMACSLIDGSSMSLAQIALDCGFCDQSHLTRTFAKRLGTTPARWRQSRSCLGTVFDVHPR
jgi:AraC family transcriptional regulator